MALPTAELVTNQYLYGQDTPPGDMSSASVVNESVRSPIVVHTLEYMQEGPGRFVSAYSFDFLRTFFSGQFLGLADNLPPGRYSKQPNSGCLWILRPIYGESA